MAGTAQWKLRRLAPRALRVLERRSPDDASVKSFETTLGPIARDYIASYDGVKRFNVTWQKELSEGHGAVSSLIQTIRAWLPRLSQDVPHFDRTTFADTRVPDDVMEDAERLQETVEEHQSLAQTSEQVASLPYAADLLGQLQPVYSTAAKEWHEAELAATQYQQALAKTRALAGQLHQELTAFRQTLASVVGRSDTDYQKLRVQRASTADPEDDPSAPQPLDPKNQKG